VNSLSAHQAIKNLAELIILSGIVSCAFVYLLWVLFLDSLLSVLAMHISIAEDIKKRFHAACAIRGLKMSQVITQLVEQWLKANDVSTSGVELCELVTKA